MPEYIFELTEEEEKMEHNFCRVKYDVLNKGTIIHSGANDSFLIQTQGIEAAQWFNGYRCDTILSCHSQMLQSAQFDQSWGTF